MTANKYVCMEGGHVVCVLCMYGDGELDLYARLETYSKVINIYDYHIYNIC